MTKRRDPKYRHQKARNLAVVRIDGRDYYLGRFGSEESKAKYHRLLAEWRARLLSPDDSIGRCKSPNHHCGNTILITDVVRKYERFAEEYYQKDGASTQPGIKIALRYLERTFGDVAAKNFGPKALKIVCLRCPGQHFVNGARLVSNHIISQVLAESLVAQFEDPLWGIAATSNRHCGPMVEQVIKERQVTRHRQVQVISYLAGDRRSLFHQVPPMSHSKLKFSIGEDSSDSHNPNPATAARCWA